MARILVTGSHGTLGRPLVLELRKRGHEVWGCDLQHQPDEQYCRADVSLYRQLERVFEQPYDYVYHLAAEFGRLNGEEYFETLWQTNVIGTRNVLELQRRHKFKLIFASSSEIYGDYPREIMTEDAPIQESIIQQNDYATTKWVNEVQCINFEKRFDLPIVRLRFFNAYGPGERYHSYRSVVCLFCYRALHGLPYTVYKNYHRVFMYIDDFIPTLVNVVDNFTPGGVYNVGGRDYRSVEELSNLIIKHLGTDDSQVAYLAEDVHNVQSKRPDISRAAAAFGHNPQVTLEDGVPRVLEWMKELYAESIAKHAALAGRHG